MDIASYRPTRSIAHGFKWHRKDNPMIFPSRKERSDNVEGLFNA